MHPECIIFPYGNGPLFTDYSKKVLHIAHCQGNYDSQKEKESVYEFSKDPCERLTDDFIAHAQLL